MGAIKIDELLQGNFSTSHLLRETEAFLSIRGDRLHQVVGLLHHPERTLYVDYQTLRQRSPRSAGRR